MRLSLVDIARIGRMTAITRLAATRPAGRAPRRINTSPEPEISNIFRDDMPERSVMPKRPHAPTANRLKSEMKEPPAHNITITYGGGFGQVPPAPMS